MLLSRVGSPSNDSQSMSLTGTVSVAPVVFSTVTSFLPMLVNLPLIVLLVEVFLSTSAACAWLAAAEQAQHEPA